MVKFKLPGDDKSEFRIGGHGYRGGTVYDNDLIKLPLHEIEKFIIKEDIKEGEGKVEKSVSVEPKVEDSLSKQEEDLSGLKEHLKNTYTVIELKAAAKSLGLSGYNKLNEDKLIDLLVDKGFRG